MLNYTMGLTKFILENHRPNDPAFSTYKLEEGGRERENERELEREGSGVGERERIYRK